MSPKTGTAFLMKFISCGCWIGIGLLLACAAPSESLPVHASPARAAQSVGKLRVLNPEESNQNRVVIIKDRHAATPGYRRVRPQVEAVQNKNRRFVEYLTKRGFSLLGCEHPKGRIDRASNPQLWKLIIEKRREGSRLDRYSIFQPMRYAILWPKTLEVWGVENQELFERDLEIFREWLKASRYAERKQISEEQRELAEENKRELAEAIRQNSDARGRAAATNLLELMESRNRNRAILMIGGAHAPAAVEHLLKSEVQVSVFEAHHYNREPQTD